MARRARSCRAWIRNTIGMHEQSLGEFKLWLEDAPPLLFTENESNTHAHVGLRQRAVV